MPTLTFPRQDQQHSNWCWAAVSVAIDHYFDSGSEWRQCGMVHAELSLPACDQFSQSCNQTHPLGVCLKRVGRSKKFGIMVATFEQVQKEIDAGRPIGVRISWKPTEPGTTESGGHFVVISGYDVTPKGVQMLVIEDPNPHVGQVTVPYDKFVAAYQKDGRWNETYYLRSAQGASFHGS